MLIDGSIAPAARQSLLSHIRGCKACAAAYRDSALLAQVIREDPSAFPAPDDLAELGKSVTRSRVSTPPKRIVLRLAPIAVVAAIGLVLLLRGGPDGLDPSVLSPLRDAAETLTARGPIVLPEAEGGIGREDDNHRSGYVPVTGAIEGSLERLYESFLNDDSDPDAAYWLAAGYLATGQIDLAREVANLAQARNTRDPRMETMAGLIALVDEDYTSAESILRRAPADAVRRLNLSVVLMRQGRFEEARSLLGELADDDAAVGARAAELLGRMGE